MTSFGTKSISKLDGKLRGIRPSRFTPAVEGDGNVNAVQSHPTIYHVPSLSRKERHLFSAQILLSRPKLQQHIERLQPHR